jgi:DNA-binding NtrC family response regulator
MLQAATYETGPSTLHCFRQAGGSQGGMADGRPGALGLAPDHRSATPLASRSTPGFRTPGSNGGASHAVARLLLIADDRALMAEHLRLAFPAPTHEVQVANTVLAGLEHVRSKSPDVIVLDLGLHGQSGLEIYQQIRGISPRVPVIVIALDKRADAAIEPIKQGVYDCLFRPLDLPLLGRVVAEAFDVARCIRNQEAGIRDRESAGDSPLTPDLANAMVGACPAMSEVYKAIGRVANQDVPVLITGESGTGKELAARAIYQHGPRANAPFMALNCAAIPETLLESELFGHEKGAFTGATQRRIGKFEQCSGGTLFLDEVGDMPLALQAKILRLLQDQTFERVGGNETIHTDVRLIAATHRDLKAWSADGKFRPDLYYRLGVFTIHLPPLRERGDDLPVVVQYYLRRFSRELGREVHKITTEALVRLRNYSWPGNVRELQSVLKQAILRAHGPVLLPEFLPEFPDGRGEPATPTAPAKAGGGPDPKDFIRQRLGSDSRDLYAETRRELDRLLLPRVLEYTGGNYRRAALLLGIARQTLRVKVKELGLHIARSTEMGIGESPVQSPGAA